jgi:hypothetical protein
LFSGGVRDATNAELMTYDQTYSGNTGSFDVNFTFVPSGSLTLVFGASGSLSYNGASQTVSSICYETAVPQLVVHYGASGHVDLKTDGSFTGVGPDGTTIIKSGSIPAGTAPAAPTGVTATAASSTQIDLSWSAVNGAQGYRIYRSTTAGQAVTAMTDILGGAVTVATNHSDSGLTAGTTYYYKIVAANSSGDSAASTEVSVTTSAAVGTTPTVSGFTPATGAVGTIVTISGSNLGNFTPAPQVKFGTTTATVSSATATSIVVTVPAGLAAGNSTITLSNFDGSGVVTVGTFNVTGGANAFPNEAISLPTTSRNAITTPTIAATDLSSVVGTYTGSKASYETNVLISDYTTGTTLNSCSLSFAADRTVTLTAGAHTYTQVIDGTNNDTWSPSLTAGEVNTGNLHAGPQTPGAGVTEIGITIGRGKVLSVMAEIVADPFTPFTPMTERLTCWMPINRTVGTAGAGWTQWLSFGSASDMPTTVTGTYIGSLVAANNVAAPVGATCQLGIAADGTMTFSTTGATTDVSFSAQIAGDTEDRVGYTDASNWNLRAKDYSNQINGTYNVITLQNIAGSLVSTAGQGTVRPVTSAGYSCLTLVKQ